MRMKLIVEQETVAEIAHRTVLEIWGSLS